MYPIAPEDVAAVAAHTLTTPGHEGKIYELSGEEGLTSTQEIEIMGRVLGLPVKVVDVSPEQGFAEARARGAPEQVAGMLRDLYVNVRANRMAHRTQTARQLLGRAPMTFEAWFRNRSP
jgi:uncharacterized protein YbjT (DUF2867 family)